MAIVRQDNVDLKEFHDVSRDAITMSATTTSVIETGQRPFRVDAVELIYDPGQALSTSNYFAFNLRVGGRSCATFSLHDTAIVAGTPSVMVLVAESGQNHVLAAGEVLDMVSTLTGTLTLTNLRVVVHGRYVG